MITLTATRERFEASGRSNSLRWSIGFHWNKVCVTNASSKSVKNCKSNHCLSQHWRPILEKSYLLKCWGVWIAEWYQTWLWSLVCCAMSWNMSSSLSDNKLFFGPKRNIYAFFLILFGLFDTIICLTNLSCGLWNTKRCQFSPVDLSALTYHPADPG